ncbi:MAG: 50S ribosomal protein L10 [Chitinophagales bacterium]|jgi:large subunit ribosomal protein L10|nr:50S ribosomal protein L10 [Chitinophagales bacterium]
MNKKQKNNEIVELKEKLESSQFFYICDSSTLSVEKINAFRRLCFAKGIEYRVAKNTLIQKALEQLEGDYKALYPVLNGPTGIMFSKESSTPAKLLKEFRTKHEKPTLKGAYIDSDIFIGDDQIIVLAALKSKAELIGDVIGLLQSPMQSVMGALQNGGGQTIAGLLKTLEEKAK